MAPLRPDHDSPPPAPRGQVFACVVSAVLWALTLGFVLGAAQVARALWSGRVWMTYRGEVITAAEMRLQLGFFALAAVVCCLLAWYWHRSWRRQS